VVWKPHNLGPGESATAVGTMDAFLSTALDRLERSVVEPLSSAAIELVDEQLSEYPEATPANATLGSHPLAGTPSGVSSSSSTPAKQGAASTSTSASDQGASSDLLRVCHVKDVYQDSKTALYHGTQRVVQGDGLTRGSMHAGAAAVHAFWTDFDLEVHSACSAR
jgi:hypothetical protein